MFNLPRFSLIFCCLTVFVVENKEGVMCQYCGGNKYEGMVRLSRDKCCNATPILCQHDQVCLRALVYSPYGNFFLSGCHPKEDNLAGCDYHTLPHNSSVHRCVCSDDECQNDFPGDCPIDGITDNMKTTKITTLRPTPSTRRTHEKEKTPRGRHHHNHSLKTSDGLRSFPSSLIVILIIITIAAIFC